jgi:hypothetical protein
MESEDDTYLTETSQAVVNIAFMQKSTGMTFECFQLKVECKK